MNKPSIFSILRVVTLSALFTSLIVACSDSETETGKKKKANPAEQKSIDTRVIYGDDNRLDLYEVTDYKWLEIADSTVALISSHQLSQNGALTNIATSPFKNSFSKPLCKEERFAEQETAAYCSGFLVGPNLIATAGHCIQTEGTPSSDCARTKFVFGFNIFQKDILPRSVPTSEVYSCDHIVARKMVGNGADYAIIALDRPVSNHQPLKLNRSGELAVRSQVTVVGHPSGLPTKVSEAGIVRSVHSGFFKASLDTYGGNSGSAVVNSETGMVEGILVRGETDYVLKNNCVTSNVCPEDGCRGEDVTRAIDFSDYVP